MKPAKVSPDSSAAVDVFMASLDHPLKAEIDSVRRLMLSASPAISEGIKWNAPSFRTTGYFATIHLRSRDALQLVFHLGAKVRKNLPDLKIEDPSGLLTWVAPDRCLVTLGAGREFKANQAVFAHIIRQWISYV
jgi:hypothetical protein